MFSFVRKSAEALGVIDEAEQFTDQYDQDPAPKPVEYINISLKQQGMVPPVVLDPAIDRKHLIELFGVYEGKKRIMDVECPNCGHEETMPYQPIPADQQVCCNNCEEEDEFSHFYEGARDEHLFSRNPTSEELFITDSSRQVDDHHRWEAWGYGRTRRNVLINYYLALEGIAMEMFSPDKPVTMTRQQGLVFIAKGVDTDGDPRELSMDLPMGSIKSLQVAQRELSLVSEED